MTVWNKIGDQYLYAIAKSNFNQDKPHRLCLDVGDSVIILAETKNWYYGYNKKNKTTLGIFPKSYVHLLECIKCKDEYVVKRSEIVTEITTVLGDWGELFKRFYLSNHANFQPIRRKIRELIRLRSQILSGNLPVDEMKEVKLQATAEIDTGNSLLGLDMVVRDESGNVLDVNSTSTTQLYEHHINAVDRIKKANNSYNKNRISKTMNKHSHNLLVTVHAFVCKFQEDSDLLLTLYDGEEMKAITENYVVKWGRQGLARDLDQFDNHRVLFTDLSSHDLNRNKVYLICYAIRLGSMEFKETDSKRGSVANAVLNPNNKKNSLQSISSNSGGADQMRRPFGVAAIDLTLIFKKPEDFNKNSFDLPFILCEKEFLDNTLKKFIINKDVGKIDSKLAVSVELLHGDIKQIKEDFPHLVHGNVAFARKMGFPEVIFPGDIRNDLYLTLVCGEFSKGTKSTDKNIEVTVVVCNEKGTVVPGVLTLGAGASFLDEYKSVIYYHEDKPKWNETFKIQVPIEEFKLCHLRFTFKHRSSNESKDKSEKPFALSYVRLMQDNGTTLQHDSHNLIVYKIDQKKFDKEAQYGYLTLPSRTFELTKNSKPSAPGLSLSVKDSFTIRTNVCSTKLTKDGETFFPFCRYDAAYTTICFVTFSVDILGLLKWASNKENLENSLIKLINIVNAEEVVKYLQDILDALFNILVQNDDPPKFDNLVFKCLLRLIETVSDMKYQHFQSVLDLYINEIFFATLAYDKLINVLQTHIKNAINNKPTETEFDLCTNSNDDLLYKTTKNLQYIMKFIIRSRILFAEMNDVKDRVLFESSLEDLLSSFVNLISCSNDLLRSQGAMLKYIHVIASDLIQVYDKIKLSHYIVEIIKNIPAGRLTQSKMICIKDLVKSKLFKYPECRAILLPVFCQQIKDKLESKEEGDFSDIWQQEKNLTKAAKVLGVKNAHLHTRETSAKTKVVECVNIMNNMLELLFTNDVGPTENDIKDIMLILLRTVIQTSIAMDRDNPLVGNLVAIMLGIFRSMKSIHYDIYVENFTHLVDLQDFLTEILLVFKDLVSKPVFANDWMDMQMHQNTVILECLRNFSKVIMDNFFYPFEKQVWSNFFHCSIAFLIQPPLQLDQFSDNKKSTILLRYEDIRRKTAEEIQKMWFNLGEHKIHFVPSIVGSILEMSLIPEEELRRTTIPIFFDMMQCEYNSSRFVHESYGDTKRNQSHIKGNFLDFEKEMIEKLDILVEGGRGDMEYKDLFHSIMMRFCMNHNTLRESGTVFVTMVTRLLDRLLEYRCIIHDESKENRMACTVSLLQFYLEVNRNEMYIRYVNKLCDLHMEFDNYTEAAFTLKLHSNLLKWNDTPLSSLLRSHRHANSVTHRQLKESLYNDIIEYFDKGKMWECAIDMCKELAEQYENEIYDYRSLSHIHMKLAQFYEKILKEMRHESEYFRVAFYGLRFPEFLRNKVFIYRGKEYERLSEFCTRILTQHPAAELMQTLTSPGDEITQSDGQYIQINSVEPMMTDDPNVSRLKDKVTAPEIVKYYQTNNVQKFKFSRPYYKDNGGGADDNTVGNFWLERTIMKTNFPLPGILRWFPVVDANTFKISPIEYAIETMELTNKAVRDLIIAHRNDENLPINPLSMKINGVVDPAVMGGFGKYEEAFLTDEYMEKNGQDHFLIDKLKDLIASQIPLLEIALSVHKSKAPANLLPFHDRLEKCFAEMKEGVENKYGKRTSDLKIDRDSFVTMRRQGVMAQMSIDSNRLSETSMGSTDSGLSKSTTARPHTNTIKSTFGFQISRTSLTNSPNSKGKPKEKQNNKPRRTSRRADRDAISLPTANSQWYATPLTPINSTPTSDKDNPICNSAPATNTTTPVFELTEELTPKRPLRSEMERERRLSRPCSTVTPTSSIKGLNSTDTQSLSDESSNRNSIVTTDSTASEEDIAVPPPLPAKSRESSDYSNLPNTDDNTGTIKQSPGKYKNKPLPALPTAAAINSSYDYVEARNFMNRAAVRPPTPPPKPSRNSKYVSM
ncbi:dedicator of cytokinesis protein 1 isoform X7 [Bradysia coprophila]|uniref:dedicator of cytokinesis protein 1 isoform X7 n=1 Tax=Bradysia coprophila TaxID=38358 RepID=UPI00187DA9ED|nr:dedicator of cytokinesis protein 1 isoform X7 [Bradysia coprophila]